MFSSLINLPIGPLMPWLLAAGFILPIQFISHSLSEWTKMPEPSKSQVSRRLQRILRGNSTTLACSQKRRPKDESRRLVFPDERLTHSGTRSKTEISTSWRRKYGKKISPFCNRMKRIRSMIRTYNGMGAKAFMK